MNEINKEMVGKTVFQVTFNRRQHVVTATTAIEAINGFVKKHAIGRYRVTKVKEYTNEAGQLETSAVCQGSRLRVRFVIFATPTDITSC